MDFLKKKRKEKKITTREAAELAGVTQPSLVLFENDEVQFGEERACKIAKALSIPEDVMTVYRGRLPKYAHKVYREKPDKLEKKIRSAVKKLEKEDE